MLEIIRKGKIETKSLKEKKRKKKETRFIKNVNERCISLGVVYKK